MPNDAAAIAEFGLANESGVVVHTLSALRLPARAELENGAEVDVGERLDWQSANETVATVNDQGVVQPVADGRTVITARDPMSNRDRRLELVVATPKASGTPLTPANGGWVETDGASIFVPPDTLARTVPVRIAPVQATELPSPPPGGTPAVALQIDAGDQRRFINHLRIRAAIEPTAPGTLVRVLRYDEVRNDWVHATYGQVMTDGAQVEFYTDHLSLFVANVCPDCAETFARRHRPEYFVDDDDVRPIAIESVIEASVVTRVERVCTGIGPTPVCTRAAIAVCPGAECAVATPTAELLLSTFDQDDIYLALQTDLASDFASIASWSTARMGGRMPAAPSPPLSPTVYYVVTLDRTGKLAVQYWSYYAVSGRFFRVPLSTDGFERWHEGDLEMVQILLDADTADARPLGMTASQHYYAEGRHWNDVPRAASDDNRPTIYVAKGAHASYFSPQASGRAPLEWPGGFDKDSFLLKFSPLIAYDFTSRDMMGDYDLVRLDRRVAAHEVLLQWSGKLGRFVQGILPGQSGVPTIAGRDPKEPSLAILNNPYRFHYAYNYSTDNAIRVYRRLVRLLGLLTVGNPVDTVDQGRCLFEVQDYLARAACNGRPVQPWLDDINNIDLIRGARNIGNQAFQADVLARFLEYSTEEPTRRCEPVFVVSGIDSPLTPLNVGVLDDGTGTGVQVQWDWIRAYFAPSVFVDRTYLVEYWPEALPNSVTSTVVTGYQVVLNGLMPDTPYRFRVRERRDDGATLSNADCVEPTRHRTGGPSTPLEPPVPPAPGTPPCLGQLENCSDPGRPQPPCRGCNQAPGGGSTGGPSTEPTDDPFARAGASMGDPHLRTFDGLGYDMQGVGEFVLVRSTDDELQVQTRTAPWRARSNVSVNIAVAARLGSDRISAYLSEAALFINGDRRVLRPGWTDLPSGGRIYRYGRVYTLEWPDGSQTRWQVKGSFINVEVFLNEDRRAAVEGLLGSYDGDTSGELTIRDGRALSPTPSFETFYTEYVESWRIRQRDSLFDYGLNETTETYTDRSFPSTSVTSADLSAAERGDAEAVCRDAGVSDATWLDACILDVGLTGEIDFADGLARLSSSTRVVGFRPSTAAAPPGMVSVPGGPFFMGCNEAVDTNCANDERPGRTVNVPAFFIDQTEVTEAAYQLCVRAGTCPALMCIGPSDDHPAICISWTMADTYCRFRGARLPSEAEWEKAARGTDGRIWPTGNTPPTCAQANTGSCFGGTWPAGSRPEAVSPYGALDMTGNVLEWTSDWYDAAQTERVNRGGSWGPDAVFARASRRFRFAPSSAFTGFGLRCAQTAP